MIIYVIAKRVRKTYPNIRLRLLVFALQNGAAAFKVEVEGYQVPGDTRVEKVTPFFDKAVEDPSYMEVEGCDSENGRQYCHGTQGLMKPLGTEGKPDDHDCGIQRQPASFGCPSNLTPQHPSCKSCTTNCDSHNKGNST